MSISRRGILWVSNTTQGELKVLDTEQKDYKIFLRRRPFRVLEAASYRAKHVMMRFLR